MSAVKPQADLVLEGGNILTMTEGGDPATGVAILGNRIVAVGGSEELAPWVGDATQRIDLAGRWVMPGVTDAHCHLGSDSQSGGTGVRVECRDFYVPVRTVADILERLSAAARENPDASEIVGVGSPMQEFRLKDGRRPTQAELDEAVPDVPAWVTFGAHILVANTKAVERAGVTAETPNPQGGMIEHFEDGRPNGVFRERARFLLITRENGPAGFQQFVENIRQNLLKAARRGVTTIHDIVASKDEVLAYQQLEREGRLPIRVQMIIRVIESGFKEWSLLDLGFQPEFGGDMLRIGGIKMSIDGGFTARQGMFHPLEHGAEPEDNHPLERITQEELDEAVINYHKGGMRICVHAIGDKSLDMILSSYEKAQKELWRDDPRHRIEHMGNFIATDEQFAKAKELGIVPMPNPSVLYYLAEAGYESLTEERMKRPMPMKTLLDAGFRFTPGSDAPGYWPVDPIRDAAFCVTRTTFAGTELLPMSEAITVEQALRTVTVDAAWMGFMEDKLGTVEVGKLADLAVLDESPMAASGEELMTIPVSLTIADGKIVYETA